jgi:hypothetical protein
MAEKRAEPGYGVLLGGPSGAGKSTLARSALIAEGSGVALLAPGDDELMSYIELDGREEYYLKGFDDPEFLPTAGLYKTEGLGLLIKTLNAVRNKAKESWEKGEELKYKVLVLDTISSMAQLAVNQMMMKCGVTDAPAAMSPEGARFYSGIRNLMEEVMRPVRACKGYGMHVIGLTHVGEKQVSKTAMAETKSKMAQMPLIVGAFREVLPAYFDLVMHAGVDQQGTPRHYMMWVSDVSRPTKSRVGSLGSTVRLPNDWRVLRQLIKEAIERRSKEGTVGMEPVDPDSGELVVTD